MMPMARPTPSMLMALSVDSTVWVKALAVNRTPWSVLKISGALLPRTRCRASRQNCPPSTDDTTAIPIQSRNEVHKPFLHRNISDVSRPDLIGSCHLDCCGFRRWIKLLLYLSDVSTSLTTASVPYTLAIDMVARILQMLSHSMISI